MDPIPQKPAAPVNPQWSETPPHRSCLGCLAILAVTSLVLCAGLCGGGYYAIFHSSLPLATIEDMLEGTGEIQMEGLTGSISKGFHIDTLKFRTDGEHWSELSQVDFEFNGVRDLAQNERLVIDKFTVGSGVVYYQPSTAEYAPGTEEAAEQEGSEMSSEGTEETPSPGEPEEPSSSDVAPMPEFDTGTGEAPFRELRIGLAEVKNLRVIDPQTGAESQVKRVSFKSFQMLQGEVKEIGELDGEGITLRDFTPRTPESPSHGAAPSHITADLSFRRDGTDESIKLTIGPGAQFQLGATTFYVTSTEARLAKDAQMSSPIEAVATTGDPAVACRVYLLKDSPFFAVELQSEVVNTPELAANVVYGQSYESLTAEQKAVVDRTCQPAPTVPAEAAP